VNHAINATPPERLQQYLGIVLLVIYLQKELRTKESENVAA